MYVCMYVHTYVRTYVCMYGMYAHTLRKDFRSPLDRNSRTNHGDDTPTVTTSQIKEKF